MESYDIFGRTLTVSEANSIIHDTVEEIFYELRLEGEISGFRPASSGHWYFTLKDSSSAIDAAVFRSAQYAMEYPKNGDLVVARGSLSFYTKTGKLTYVIREMKRNFAFIHAQIIYDGDVCSEADMTYYCFSQEKSAADFYFKGCEVEE